MTAPEVGHIVTARAVKDSFESRDCPCDYVGGTSAIHQIAADLTHRPSRQLRAKRRHPRAVIPLFGHVEHRVGWSVARRVSDSDFIV